VRILLTRVSRHLVVLIPASMLLGFAAGLVWDVSWFKSLVLPATFLMIYPMMVNFKPQAALSMKDSKPVAASLVQNFAIIPLIGFGLGSLFFADRPELFIGLILASLFPTSGMTISWTGFAKGNVEAAVKMTVVGLIVGALVAPFYLQALAGKLIPVNITEVSLQILLIVFLPMILGWATRKSLVETVGKVAFQKKWAPIFPGISTIGVLVIVFIAIALKAKGLVASPDVLPAILVPLAIFYAINFLLSTVVGKLFFDRDNAIALVYGTVMRNLSIALGIAVTAFGPQTALVLAVGYIIQVQAAAWYVKFTPSVFGPALEEVRASSSAA